MKLDDNFLEALHRIGAKDGQEYGDPVAKKLALLLRPAFVARPRKTLVWGDFSNIEARVLPWLAASPGAEAKLDIFRAVDKDPKVPDVYMRTGCDLTGRDVDEMWAALKDESNPLFKQAGETRQAYGKVPELSLGFGGGLGALLAMAANYSVYLDTKTAKRVVGDWRANNEWAVDFWGKHTRNTSYGLWGAANSAIEDPDTPYEAGRVAFVYDPAYLGGTLFCALPDQRVLTYPSIKWEWREVKDKKTGELVDRYQLTYVKSYGRVAAWYGKFAENVTQAVAASVLRRTLKRLRHEWHAVDAKTRRRYDDWFPVVMHTHDEIVTETWEDDADEVSEALRGIMERNDEWDEGLPLAADIASNWYYTKAKI
jgi:DNA polymerase